MNSDAMPAAAAARRPTDPARLTEFGQDPIAPPAGEVRVNNLVLWLATMSGPVSWALHLMLMYPGVEVACRFQTTMPLYALSAVLFGTTALGGLVNWMYLRYMQRLDGATTARRVRFMATAGLLGCVLFGILIIGGTLPVFFDDPCQLQGRRRPSLIPFL
jgi:hypothetical protein